MLNSISFLDTLYQSVTSNSEKTAIRSGGKSVSYKDIVQQACLIQRSITETANKGPLGIVLSDGAEPYAAILACWFLGYSYVPINAELPEERLLSIVATSAISHIIGDSVPKSLEHLLLRVPKAINNDFQLDLTFYTPTPETTAYILFTSGSTGVPKGVPISFANIESFVESYSSLGFEHSSDERFLQMFDLTFDLSVMSYLIPLLHGASFSTVRSGGMKFMSIASILEDDEITTALMVPSVLVFLRKYFDEFEFPSLRHSLFCGEALPCSLAQEWQKIVPNAEIVNVYGPTEATIFCSEYVLPKSSEPKHYNSTVSIGKSLGNSRLIVIDEQSKPITSANVKGELCIGGPQVTSGYLKREDLNTSRFISIDSSRYYRSGDICFVDEAGDIFYVGRLDSQVQIQGFRVELGEIEYYAEQAAPGATIIAVAKETDSKGTVVVVFAKSLPNSSEHLLSQLRKSLPGYMVPNDCVELEAFPLNSNGKIDRLELIKRITV